jgi:hypothetical protein
LKGRRRGKWAAMTKAGGQKGFKDTVEDLFVFVEDEAQVNEVSWKDLFKTK